MGCPDVTHSIPIERERERELRREGGKSLLSDKIEGKGEREEGCEGGLASALVTMVGTLGRRNSGGVGFIGTPKGVGWRVF